MKTTPTPLDSRRTPINMGLPTYTPSHLVLTSAFSHHVPSVVTLTGCGCDLVEVRDPDRFHYVVCDPDRLQL